MQVSANSHNFRFWLRALHIPNLWNHCSNKYDSNLIFGGFLTLGPTVAKAGRNNDGLSVLARLMTVMECFFLKMTGKI